MNQIKTMKKKIIVICTLLYFLSNVSKAASVPAWAWGHTFNGSVNAMTSSGDYIYTAGVFSNGPFVLGNMNIANQGAGDVLIAKWDTLGNLLWATSIWGSANDTVVSIKVNVNNELIIVGSTNSPVLNAGAVSWLIIIKCRAFSLSIFRSILNFTFS